MRTLNFLALSMLTLSVGLAGDHPIIISNDSPLKIEHDKWKQNDDQHLGSKIHDSVTRVAISSAGKALPPINFNHEMLTLDLNYGDLHLTVTTGANGQDPVLTINKSVKNDFQLQKNAFVSNDKSSTIDKKVTVLKANADQGVSDVLEPSRITICYGKPTPASLDECK